MSVVIAHRQYRLIALVLLFAASACAVASIAWPLSRAFDMTRAIKHRREALRAIQQASSATSGTLESQVAALVSGETAGQANAELQQRISTLARSAGVVIRSIQARPARREADLVEIGVEVAFRADSRSLRLMMSELEAGVPVVIVDDLQLRALSSGGEQPGRPVQLDTSMRLRAFAAVKDVP